jgi:hypothetical protein
VNATATALKRVSHTVLPPPNAFANGDMFGMNMEIVFKRKTAPKKNPNATKMKIMAARRTIAKKDVTAQNYAEPRTSAFAKTDISEMMMEFAWSEVSVSPAIIQTKTTAPAAIIVSPHATEKLFVVL